MTGKNLASYKDKGSLDRSRLKVNFLRLTQKWVKITMYRLELGSIPFVCWVSQRRGHTMRTAAPGSIYLDRPSHGFVRGLPIIQIASRRLLSDQDTRGAANTWKLG